MSNIIVSINFVHMVVQLMVGSLNFLEVEYPAIANTDLFQARDWYYYLYVNPLLFSSEMV